MPNKTPHKDNIKSKEKASAKPRLSQPPSAFDGEGYNLLFMPHFSFETGRKTPKY